MRPSQRKFSFGTQRGTKRTKTCKKCAGSGVVERQRIQLTCNACNGRGYVDTLVNQDNIGDEGDD